MIQSDKLTKVYRNGVRALQQLDIEIEPGEWFCMLGANGAGKSTAIHLFLGLIEPTSGRAFVNGIDVQKSPIEARRRVAYVPEQVALYDDLTAVENAKFFARIGNPNKVSKADIRHALTQVGLQKEFFGRDVRVFSKGMRQKVALAICILRRASAIFLDEPTAGLAPETAAELMQILRREKEQGMAIFMSTHDLFRARDVASRIGILNKGRLITLLEQSQVQSEDLEKVYLRYMREDHPNASADSSDGNKPEETT